MGVALQPSTVENLWAQARELTQRAAEEADHAALRRALVVLAVAGSGGDPNAFRALADAVAAASRRTRTHRIAASAPPTSPGTSWSRSAMPTA